MNSQEVWVRFVPLEIYPREFLHSLRPHPVEPNPKVRLQTYNFDAVTSHTFFFFVKLLSANLLTVIIASLHET